MSTQEHKPPLQPSPLKKKPKLHDNPNKEERFSGLMIIDKISLNDVNFYYAKVIRKYQVKVQYFMYNLYQQYSANPDAFLEEYFPNEIDFICNFRKAPGQNELSMAQNPNPAYRDRAFIMFVYRPDPNRLPQTPLEWGQQLSQSIRNYVDSFNFLPYKSAPIYQIYTSELPRPSLTDIFFDKELGMIVELIWPTETTEDLENLKDDRDVLKALFGHNLSDEVLERKMTELWNRWIH